MVKEELKFVGIKFNFVNFLCFWVCNKFIFLVFKYVEIGFEIVVLGLLNGILCLLSWLSDS